MVQKIVVRIPHVDDERQLVEVFSLPPVKQVQVDSEGPSFYRFSACSELILFADIVSKAFDSLPFRQAAVSTLQLSSDIFIEW